MGMSNGGPVTLGFEGDLGYSVPPQPHYGVRRGKSGTQNLESLRPGIFSQNKLICEY